MAIDFYNLTNKSDNTTYFYSSGIWNKPAGITMINIIAIGAGGGGGGGCQRVGAVTGCGGGGGGGGGISKITVPAVLLPESLKITVGLGGSGGTGAGVAGSNGGASFVDLPNNDGTATYRVINANGGGGGQQSQTSGTGGIAGSAAAQSSITEAL